MKSFFISILTGLLGLLGVYQSTQTGVYQLSSKTFGSITQTAGYNYPTSSYAFNDGDIINAGDFNDILGYLGTRSSTDTTSISYQVNNINVASATNFLGIAHGGTATSSFPTTQSIVIASGTASFVGIPTNGNGSLLIASGTTWTAQTLSAATNTTITNTAGKITISATANVNTQQSLGTSTSPVGKYIVYATSTDFGAAGNNDSYNINILISAVSNWSNTEASWNLTVNNVVVASSSIIAPNASMAYFISGKIFNANSSTSVNTAFMAGGSNDGLQSGTLNPLSLNATALSVNMSTTSIIRFSIRDDTRAVTLKNFEITKLLPTGTF